MSALISLVIDQRRRDLDGFDVGRLLPHATQRMVGPFIFFDHMGPVNFAPGIPRSVDVRPHPHIGLATVTYLFDGEIMHRDSVGSEQPIRPGEVNWMIAGRGITHSERFERARSHGGRMHGIQAWVALPDEHEETEPSFHHYAASELPAIQERGMRGRLIAGEALGLRSPVRTFSPLFYVHCSLEQGARAELDARYPERAVYIANGSVDIDGQTFGEGVMPVFTPGKTVVITALAPATVMMLGGEPVGERFIEWNFVASTRERIERAKADWRGGRFKLPDFDHAEFIPLPGDAQAAPNPMS